MKNNLLSFVMIFFALSLFAQRNDESFLKVRILQKFKVEKLSLLDEEFYLLSSSNELNVPPGFYHVKGRVAYLVKSSYPKDRNYEPSGIKLVYYSKSEAIKDDYVRWQMEPRICLIYSVYLDNFLDEDQRDYLEIFDRQSGLVIFVLQN